MTEKKELDNGDLISQVRLRGIKPSQVYKSIEVMEDDGFKQAIEAEVDYRIYVKEKEAEEELNEEMRQEIEEERLKENEFIPLPDSDYGISKPEGEKTEQKKEKKESSDDNPLIPDDSEGEGSDETNELIPD